jgi:hypothetical protein
MTHDPDYILDENEMWVVMPDGTIAVMHTDGNPVPAGHTLELIEKPNEPGVFLHRYVPLQ